MTSWKVRSLRLTMFLASDAGQKASALEWEQLTRYKPENVINRGDNQAQEGPLGPGRLLLQKQMPSRLDVLYAGFPKADSPEDPVATLGDLEPSSDPLVGIAQKLFQKVNSCVRLALGSEMVTPAGSPIEAYRLLVEHMGSASFKLAGGHEFIYQMNRPRGSKVVPSLLVNRLTRWNASSWQPVTFEVGGVATIVRGQPKIGAVITTDVNTGGDRTEPLPSAKLLPLLSELREMTIEIRDKGDTP